MAAIGSCSSGLIRCSAPTAFALCEPGVVDVDGDHRRAGDARVLDREVAQPARAEHRDHARGPGAGVLDRLVGRHARARQRRGVRRIDAVRDAHDVARVADRVLGEGAVERVAHVLLLQAERLAPAVAVAAHATGVAEPRQRDAHPRLQPVHRAGAQSLDHPDAFVAGDERRRRLDRPLAARGVDVGMAEPARLHAHEHLAGARHGNGQVLDLQRAIERADDSGLHGSSSLRFNGMAQASHRGPFASIGKSPLVAAGKRGWPRARRLRLSPL